MCMNSSELIPSHSLYSVVRRRRPSKRPNVQVRRLNRRRSSSKEKVIVGVKTEMEIKNLKLYMENQSIIEENEKLREKALLLHQENKALLSQLQKKFSHDHPHNHLAHNTTSNNNNNNVVH